MEPQGAFARPKNVPSTEQGPLMDLQTPPVTNMGQAGPGNASRGVRRKIWGKRKVGSSTGGGGGARRAVS